MHLVALWIRWPVVVIDDDDYDGDDDVDDDGCEGKKIRDRPGLQKL